MPKLTDFMVDEIDQEGLDAGRELAKIVKLFKKNQVPEDMFLKIVKMAWLMGDL